MPKGVYERKPIDQRFWDKVAGGDEINVCWEWKAKKDKDGYAVFHYAETNKHVKGHRWSYERFVGPIPLGLTIDHLCNNPSCVNPAHLEPATATDNAMRGNGIMARNARKTHCLRGHPLTGDNLAPSAPGRVCRECIRIRGQSPDYRAKKAEYRRQHRKENRNGNQ